MFATIATLATSILLSFIQPWGNVRTEPPTHAPLLEGATVPTEVRNIFEHKCADCHSGNTHWPTYSRFAPASWLIERDVQKGRVHLDLSQWQRYDQESRIDLLSKIGSEARSGEMPVKQYLFLHPDAKLSPAEQQLLYDWAKSERKLLKHQLAAAQQNSSANQENNDDSNRDIHAAQRRQVHHISFTAEVSSLPDSPVRSAPLSKIKR